jgi:hypothetical protein
MTQGGSKKEHQMSQAEKAQTLQSLYFVLYETAKLQAENADTNEESAIIMSEARKFLTKISKLEDAIA